MHDPFPASRRSFFVALNEKKKTVKMIAALCGKLIAEVGYYFLALNLPFYDPQLSVHLYNRRKGLKADLK